MSRALILSGSIGLGHDVVAEACGAALHGAGWDSEIVDCMAMLGGYESRLSGAIMHGLMVSPGVYDAFHFNHLRTGGRLASFLDSTAARKLARPLGEELSRRPAQLLLSVFATGAGAVSRLKESRSRSTGVAGAGSGAGPAPVSVVYCTDACPHSMWVHEGTDLFLVTSEMSAGFVRYHRPAARVAVVPPGARPAFYEPVDRTEARERLGLPAGVPVAVVMAGAWGMAPLDALAAALSDAGVHALAVAGTNRGLEKKLREAAAAHPLVRPFGFTDRIPELMAAADVVVTTPGDTCTEARLLRRPLLLLDTVPGHGRENLQLELSRGGATAVAARPGLVAEATRVLIERSRTEPPPPPVPDRQEWARAFLAALAGVGLEVR